MKVASSKSYAPLPFYRPQVEEKNVLLVISHSLHARLLMIGFSFSKTEGLRSYGKVVYAFGTLPLLGYFVVCVKVLGYSSSIPNIGGIGGVLDRTPWNEFFIDTKVWVVAAREVFMTWGVCGAIVMQIASHNRYNHPLRRDVTIVIALTLFTLLLSGFLASACLQILNFRGPYDYRTDSSFGKLKNLLESLSINFIDDVEMLRIS